MLNPFLFQGWASSTARLAIAAGVTLAFALLARAVRGVNPSGAVAGALACFLLFAGAGPVAFAALGTLFLMTWMSTRLGYRRKAALGLAERREGRSAWQVLANLSAAAIGSVAFGITGSRGWLVAAVAALAEAATDTVASEIGQVVGESSGTNSGANGGQDAGPHPRMITTMITTGKRVPPGTDGGVTLRGSAAGLAAGAVVAAVASAGGMIEWRQVWIPVTVGFAGMLIDSVLGATVQSRGWISNQGVNLLSTLAAAALAYAVAALT
jgi:uncharacterized membrane protein